MQTKTKRIRWERIAVHIAAWFAGLIWIIPFMGILMASIRPQKELIHGWWNLSEITISLDNFINAWSHPTAPIGQGIWNSLIVTIPATILPLIIASFAAYGLLRLRFPGRRIILVTIVLLLSIPQQMVAVPLFRTLLDLGILNTFQGLIITHTAWGLIWITIFMRNYLTTLPEEVEEAASIDGANRFQIFFKIVFPLSLPGLASVAALQFTWVWNDFFMALITLYEPSMLVATQRIPLLKGQYNVDWGVLSAASILVTAIPLLIFIVLQKYYVKGLIGWTSK
ncbi:MAG: carbohydrate ABC transporter permease [Anaerolineaceae bacterium]|nr:carbohydrate ABC transporter permease [Anaerolineaceae bacterium]